MTAGAAPAPASDSAPSLHDEPGWRGLVRTPAMVGVVVAVGLMFMAWLLPAAFNWNIHMRSWPPLHAVWEPRVGSGTIAALVLGALGIAYAARLAQSLSWRALLLLSYVTSFAWLTSLALVDGEDGIGVILDYKFEYMNTARRIDSWSALSTMLHEYVARIDADRADHWAPHVAGHPPGAVMFFIGLVAIGLSTGLAAGWAVIVVASTTSLAVLQTLRVLGAEAAARRAAPFLVLGPAAIWMAVSADAVFGAVSAWGLCCLAVACTRSVVQRHGGVDRPGRSAPRVRRDDVLRPAAAGAGGGGDPGHHPTRRAAAVDRRRGALRGAGLRRCRVLVVGGAPGAARAAVPRGGRQPAAAVLPVGRPGGAGLERRDRDVRRGRHGAGAALVDRGGRG